MGPRRPAPPMNEVRRETACPSSPRKAPPARESFRLLDDRLEVFGQARVVEAVVDLEHHSLAFLARF